MAFVAGGAIESGVERAECLVDSPAQCPTNDVLAVEPDMPPPNAVRSHPIVEAGHTIVAGASGVLMGDRIFWIDGVPFWK